MNARRRIPYWPRRIVESVLWRWPDNRRLFQRWRAGCYAQHVAWSVRHPAPFLASHLPRGYGRGFSERAVEYGWAAAQDPRGAVLDAGSALNHRVVLEHLLPRVASLTIVTLAPETPSFPELGVGYVYGDLRLLDIPTDTYDAVICISTLEHVGLGSILENAAQTGVGRRALASTRTRLTIGPLFNRHDHQ